MQRKRTMNAQAIRFKQFSRKAYGVFNSLHRVVNTGVVSTSVLLFANAENDSIGNTKRGYMPFEPQGLDPDELQAFENELLLATTALAAQASANVGPVEQTAFQDEPSVVPCRRPFIQTKIPHFAPTGRILLSSSQKLCPTIGHRPIQDFFSETKDKLCPHLSRFVPRWKDDPDSFPGYPQFN
ncbi:MAG: hypothetical protein H6Q14_969 [Bacteroidetes bacterium]|jgi:hypothetical protein|nr:hypothetical protein [Bacteroidota bacterium]